VAQDVAGEKKKFGISQVRGGDLERGVSIGMSMRAAGRERRDFRPATACQVCSGEGGRRYKTD